MIVVMLERPVEIGAAEVAGAVQAALGGDVAATVRIAADNPGGMRYFTWACAGVRYNLGVCPDPWNMDERPRMDAESQRAWDAHCAWLYVNALLREEHEHDAHLANVLRVGSQFAGRGLLVWWYGRGLAAVPTERVLEAMGRGEWMA